MFGRVDYAPPSPNPHPHTSTILFQTLIREYFGWREKLNFKFHCVSGKVKFAMEKGLGKLLFLEDFYSNIGRFLKILI